MTVLVRPCNFTIRTALANNMKPHILATKYVNRKRFYFVILSQISVNNRKKNCVGIKLIVHIYE